jgi:hypothetical protein
VPLSENRYTLYPEALWAPVFTVDPIQFLTAARDSPNVTLILAEGPRD